MCIYVVIHTILLHMSSLSQFYVEIFKLVHVGLEQTKPNKTNKKRQRDRGTE